MKKFLDTALQWVLNLRAQIEAHMEGKLVLTERAKIGIVTGGALAILAAWLGLNTWVGHIEHEYHDVGFNLSRLKSQVESGAWSGRKNQSHLLKSTLEDRLWIAETPGLAEAGFERWLRDHMKGEPQQIQIRRVPLIQTSEAKGSGNPNDPMTDSQRMTAKILVPFDEAALLRLLADIAESNKVVTVDRLIVRAGRNARVEMDVSTFFRYHERGR